MKKKIELRAASDDVRHFDNTSLTEEILLRAWNESTSAGIIIPIYINNHWNEINKKKKSIISDHIQSLDIRRDQIKHAIISGEWPGTTSLSSKKLFIEISKSNNLLKSLIPTFDSIWSTDNSWEDLSLYKGRSMIFYQCTHEKFGEIAITSKNTASKSSLSRSESSSWLLSGIELSASDIDEIFS